MTGTRSMAVLALCAVVSLSGCCSWCQRHCAATAQPVAYAPAPAPAACCVPCCCVPAGGAAVAAPVAPPPVAAAPAGWQRTYSPGTCVCQ
jgi:hypothetical protein